MARELEEGIEQKPYFEAVPTPSPMPEEGTREMGELYPFQDEISKGFVAMCPSMPSIEYWFLLHYEDYTGLLKGYPAVSNRLAPYMKSCFTDSSKGLKQLLKKGKYLKDATWVKNLCADGKLLIAIKRAEENIKKAIETGELEKQSYSYVYRVFKKE